MWLLFKHFDMLVKFSIERIFFQKGKKGLNSLPHVSTQKKYVYASTFPKFLQSVLSCIKLCHSLSLYFNVHYKNYIGYTYVMSMSCRVKPVYPLLLFTLYPFGYVMYYYFSTFNLTYKVLLIFRLHFYLKYEIVRYRPSPF